MNATQEQITRLNLSTSVPLLTTSEICNVISRLSDDEIEVLKSYMTQEQLTQINKGK